MFLRTTLAILLLVLLSACSSIAGTVANKEYIAAWSEKIPAGYRYDCGYLPFKGKFACEFGYFGSKTDHHWEQFILYIVDTDGGTWRVPVNSDQYNRYEIGATYP